jgi:hypothetical protein
VCKLSYLANDPVDATREVADLAREVPIPARQIPIQARKVPIQARDAVEQAKDFSKSGLSLFLSLPRAAGKGKRGSAAAARNKQDLAGFA